MSFSRNALLILGTFRNVILMVVARSHGCVLFVLIFWTIKSSYWLIN